MMREKPKPYDPLKRRFLALAALSGSFDPTSVLKTLLPDPFGKEQLVRTMQMLSEVSGSFLIEKRKGGDFWQMRMSPRHKMTQALKEAGRLPDGVDLGEGEAAVHALFGTGSFAVDRLQDLLQRTDGATDPDVLRQRVEMLRRAGPAAPGYALIDGLQARANRQAVDWRNDAALARGFFGRRQELDRALKWLFETEPTSKVSTLHVSGLPGTGKSYLIERIFQVARDHAAHPILIRLDFDRAALRALDPLGLFHEISRQVGEALPVQAARLRSAREGTIGQKGMQGTSTSDDLPRRLMSDLGGVLAGAGRPVALFLDTLEALRAEGDTHVLRLFENLDRLVREAGGLRIGVISAGRAEAMHPARKRLAGEPIMLKGLEEKAAFALLEQREVAPAHWEPVYKVTRGNPLGLVLAAKAVSDNPDILDDLPQEQESERGALAIEGYLYRAILSRVPDHLRGYANEGLLVHRVNPQVLAEVVAPALGARLSLDEAGRILDELQRHHWLVTEERIGADHWTMHRADIRSVVLPLIYAEGHAAGPSDEPNAASTVAAEIDRRAAQWFEIRAPVTALYHRLQMLRHGASLPEVPYGLARDFTDEMLQDLLPRARDAVLQARGQRSGFARAGAEMAPPQAALQTAWQAMDPPGGPVIEWYHQRLILRDEATKPNWQDERLERDLEIMLDKGDLREVGAILQQGLSGAVPLGTVLADLILVYLWWTGQWTTARRIYEQTPWGEWDAFFRIELPARKLAHLEMRAEWDAARLVAAMTDEGIEAEVIDITGYAEGKGLAGGALAFVFASVFDKAKLGTSMTGYIGRAYDFMVPYMSLNLTVPQGRVVEDAHRLRSEFELALKDADPDTDPGTFAGRIAAPLTPYGGLAHTLIRTYEDLGSAGGVLWTYLEGVRRGFNTALTLAAPHMHSLSDTPAEQSGVEVSDMAALLNAAGLSGQWLSAFAFAHPVADLPHLAEAAERWRRTVNGRWAYDAPPPKTWMDRPTADDESTALVEGMSTDAAAGAIRFWLAPDGAPSDKLAARFASRSGRIVTEALQRLAGGSVPPSALADLLSQFGLPMVHACAGVAVTPETESADPSVFDGFAALKRPGFRSLN